MEREAENILNIDENSDENGAKNQNEAEEEDDNKDNEKPRAKTSIADPYFSLLSLLLVPMMIFQNFGASSVSI